ncbi:hypothetical protein [Alloactinosynnema sp. L-07]|uniref:hypothetical protein n=1 Tax=Alloactinosynnema sp. L-07 TaxID=1653480 RepID=UPI00065F005D|nr:hypothetical protein [Alloactinosynnema sp. L-07]CRK58668.1 hypothetical protein [Alloactinosynnema sp. L-07]
MSHDHQQTEVPPLTWGTNRHGGAYYAGRVHVASDIPRDRAVRAADQRHVEQAAEWAAVVPRVLDGRDGVAVPRLPASPALPPGTPSH